MPRTVANNKISDELAATLDRAAELLKAEFGADHHHRVMCRGQIVWSSHSEHNKQKASGPDSPTEYF